ncbi:UV-damaged DNA-binding protein rad7 [Dimargaris verticillata]|uniref:UV-damaged DNA-binding protein rad7 n=1 Tax=Dimargaris verticillata TaxID=2761393 RepID=A0A9W8EDN1_9FUNG|nr:UV-damaged DNA-binding protein rad7 [Dimargaris verticillata]
MSRRRRDVRGPTSALTSFLQEQGVTLLVRRQARERHEELLRQNQADGTNTATPTDGDPEAPSEPDAEVAAVRVTRRQTRQQIAQDSTAEEALTTIETTVENAAPARGSRRRKVRPAGYRSDSEDDDFRPGPSQPSSSSRPNPKNKTGNRMLFCDKCKCRFLLRGSDAWAPGPKLCAPCQRSTQKQSSGAAPAPRRARKKRRAQKQNIGFEQHQGPLSLVNQCIQLIGKHIHDVESLGDIGETNMDKISRIISKRRELSPESLLLFLRPDNERLCLYDSTRLPPTSLAQIAYVCPYLTHLHLDFCGRMDDRTLDLFAQNLPGLQSFHAHGTFLTTDAAFARFLTARGPQLESFSLSQVPKFSREGMLALVQTARRLTSLRLESCERVDDDSLLLLADPAVSTLDQLEHLDLSRPGAATVVGAVHSTYNLQDEVIVRIVQQFGPGLRVLNLNGCHTLTDCVLNDGILLCCPRIEMLGLSECTGLTEEGLVRFFVQWKDRYPIDTGLSRLDLSRCYQATDRVVQALVYHSGPALEDLNLNGLSLLTNRGLHALVGGLTLDDAWKAKVLHICDRLARERARELADDAAFLNTEASPSSVEAGPAPTMDHDQEERSTEATSEPRHSLVPVNDGNSSTAPLSAQEANHAGTHGEHNNDGRDDDGSEEDDEEESLAVLNERCRTVCPNLSRLDVSWCRSVDDDSLTLLLTHCPGLSRVTVWGCNHVTTFAPKREGFAYIGRECDTN